MSQTGFLTGDHVRVHDAFACSGIKKFLDFYELGGSGGLVFGQDCCFELADCCLRAALRHAISHAAPEALTQTLCGGLLQG